MILIHKFTPAFPLRFLQWTNFLAIGLILLAGGTTLSADEPAVAEAKPENTQANEVNQANDSATQDETGEVEKLLNKLPESEKPIRLFNGKDLTGWEGKPGRWFVEEGTIVGRNDDLVPTSTYLLTKDKFREFRLLLETKQTVSPKHSTMHSAVCALGERFNDQGNDFGFKGPLLMFSHTWGIWDAYRRNMIAQGHPGYKAEKKGDWNLIEILIIGNRIRMVANGTLVFDFTDKPEMLVESPIGLQLHSNGSPQEHAFRQLYLTQNPEDQLITLGE